MEIYSDGILNLKKIQKIEKNYISNIFSEKLKNNLVKIILRYLDIKEICEFSKTCIFIYNNFIDYENFIINENLEDIGQKSLC